MQTIKYLIDIVLHLNEHLVQFVSLYGAWIYVLLFVIIFCETGLVVTAILPGDSLLFAAGTIAAAGKMNIYWLIILLVVAAFLGNVVNYWIGNKLGHLLFTDEKSKLFKKSYLNKTHQFYEKYGAKTIIIARFLPIIRTFAPFVAGMGSMSIVKFLTYNLVGAVLWVGLIVGISYFFGNLAIVRDNFPMVIMIIIILSILPPIIEVIRTRKSA